MFVRTDKCVFLLMYILFMRVFVPHLLDENDVNIFDTVEIRHFNTSNYTRSVVGEVHLLNLINELLLFLSISLIFDISIHGRKTKTRVNKTLFTKSPDVVASFKYGRICLLF